jgi:uncharacterized protein (DUF1697 family)
VASLSRFVVLLRGVNVGKGNRVPMAEFRALLEDLGHRECRTLLNSGNAVFSAPGGLTVQLAAGIAGALQDRLGVSTPVIVKTSSEFEAIVEHNPIVPAADEHARFLVAFTMDRARLQELAALARLLLAGERLVITDHAAYLHCSGGLLESKAGDALLGKLGRGVTTRNWSTTLKLLALLREGAQGSPAGRQ